MDSPKGTVLLTDEPKRIAKKIKSAVTDSGTEVRYDREEKAGISNLIELMAAATGRTIEEVEADHADSRYGDFKVAVAEAVVEMLRPVQERHAELAEDPGAVEAALRTGAEKAREVAAPTLEKAKAAMGFLAP